VWPGSEKDSEFSMSIFLHHVQIYFQKDGGNYLLYFYFFLAIVRFELGALRVLGRHSIT
jgi:hypothetical protein